MDWPTAAIIAGAIATLGTFLWAIVSHRHSIEAKQQEEKVDEKELASRIQVLEEWKHEISATIHQLRQEIEHVKEIGDIKDTATREQLTRMEQQLNELVTILIKFLGSQDKE